MKVLIIGFSLLGVSLTWLGLRILTRGNVTFTRRQVQDYTVTGSESQMFGSIVLVLGLLTLLVSVIAFRKRDEL